MMVQRAEMDPINRLKVWQATGMDIRVPNRLIGALVEANRISMDAQARALSALESARIRNRRARIWAGAAAAFCVLAWLPLILGAV